MKKLAAYLLSFAESLFLRAHGWKRNAQGEWAVPPNYFWEKKRGRLYNKGHAVNSQKLTNRHTRFYEHDDGMQLLHPEETEGAGEGGEAKSGVVES